LRDIVSADGEPVRAPWPHMSSDERRAVIGAVIESVAIAPTTRSDNKFNANRVSINWKV